MIRQSRNEASASMTNSERVMWNTRAIAVLIPIMSGLSYFMQLGIGVQVLFWGGALMMFMAFISLVYDAGSHIEKTLEGGALPSNSLLSRSTRLQLLMGMGIYLSPQLIAYATHLFAANPIPWGVSMELAHGANSTGLAPVLLVVQSLALPALVMALQVAPFALLLTLLPAVFFFLPVALNMLFISVSLGTFTMGYVLLMVTVELREALLYNLLFLPLVAMSSAFAFTLNHHRKSYSSG